MRVLICGDRTWSNRDAILKYLCSCPKNTVMISGGCQGVDQLAEEAARGLGLRCLIFKANWKRFGRAAGPLRNQQMLDEGRPDEVVAFHDNLAVSRGTRDMVRRAIKAGIKVWLRDSELQEVSL